MSDPVKFKCREIMVKYFGPATGRKVDSMTDDSCVEECKKIVINYLGREKAEIFNSL